MVPAISCGDRVKIDHYWEGVELAEGDIIQFVPIACRDKDPAWYSVESVLHRIVHVSGADADGRRRYLTRGDNNSAHDCLVDPIYIVGVVSAIYAPDGSKKPLAAAQG